MALKESYDFVIESSVAAGSTDMQNGPVIPNGKTARILNFGGFDPLTNDQVHSIIVLQWGSGTSWKTVRAGGGGIFNFEFLKGKDYIGDGTKYFRLVRQNKSSVAKNLILWLQAVIL